MAPATAAPASLRTKLDRALAGSGVAPHATGALAVDLRTGRVAYSRNPDTPFIPASNEKLPVALAALDRLGPRFRIATRVYGEGSQEGKVWRGRLVLKGFGDPTLTRAGLRSLARAVRANGIVEVTGGVRGDESYFDARRTAPGWKPSYVKVYCPPLSALVVDRARANGRVVDRPAVAAARLFRQILVEEGVRVHGGAGAGTASKGAVELGAIASPRLARIVRVMNRRSDNFHAEMLLKKLGAYKRGLGTTAAGALVVRNVLRERNVPLAGVRIADGSGLSAHDRLTARAIVRILRSARADPAVSAPFFDSLPAAGMQGTLKTRLRKPPAYARVRAKTGTTSYSSALSGYVRASWVFAVVQNGSPVPWTSSRASQDRFAQALAGAP